MKQIKYKVRPPTSNDSAIRHEMSDSDLLWILRQCKEVNKFVELCKLYYSPGYTRLISSNPNMPKQTPPYGIGHNSVKTMCEGLLRNFETGQFSMSDKSCTGIQEAFRVVNELDESFEAVEFIDVDKIPLNPSSELSGTTLPDLFDIESIMVTYRKK